MSLLETTLCVGANIVSSVTLILANKWIVLRENFAHMTILSCLHFYFSFFVCGILLMLGVFQYKPVNNFSHLLRISLGSLASIIFMNLNLAHNSVGFYQLSKLAAIPCTLVVESILNVRHQELTFPMATSLLLISVGLGIFIVNDIDFNIVGSIWAILAVVSTSLAQVWFSPLQRELQLNSIQLLVHTTPILTLGSFCMIPLFEERKDVMELKLTYSLFQSVLFSCVCAVCQNISNYLVLEKTSPITYTVLGHIKTLLILFLGGKLFDTSTLSMRSVIGMGSALVGVILYSVDNFKQQQNREEKKRNASKISSSSSSSNSNVFLNSKSDGSKV
jgi:solute carrier family 35 protein E3